MGRYFGTDGVRGKANAFLTPQLAFNLGRAGAYELTKERAHAPRILLAEDSRISGEMLSNALAAGMYSVGANVMRAGILPTPAVAYLTRKYGFDAGVMVSASHNKFSDNGIKFFNADGYKLKDETEAEIERYMDFAPEEIPNAEGAFVGRALPPTDLLRDYLSFLKATVETDGAACLSGLRVALDCANGATYGAAPLLFRELGAEVFVTCNKPNGVNINDGCGSTHPETIAAFVKHTGADVGFAFDGDGDRLIAADENGSVVDGDQIMSIIAKHLASSGKLAKNTIVATVMSNLGLFLMAERSGLRVEQTQVGDRYVLEKMLEGGYNFGGEQSGHLIFLDHSTTGDGILSALSLAAIMKEAARPFSEINSHMTKLPQVLINAAVAANRKHDYLGNEKISAACLELERSFHGKGRVLIRPSGTENCVRVMLEGENEGEIRDAAKRMAALIEDELGESD